jgi:hypothetical protein
MARIQWSVPSGTEFINNLAAEILTHCLACQVTLGLEGKTTAAK